MLRWQIISHSCDKRSRAHCENDDDGDDNSTKAISRSKRQRTISSALYECNERVYVYIMFYFCSLHSGFVCLNASIMAMNSKNKQNEIRKKELRLPPILGDITSLFFHYSVHSSFAHLCSVKTNNVKTGIIHTRLYHFHFFFIVDGDECVCACLDFLSVSPMTHKIVIPFSVVYVRMCHKNV